MKAGLQLDATLLTINHVGLLCQRKAAEFGKGPQTNAGTHARLPAGINISTALPEKHVFQPATNAAHRKVQGIKNDDVAIMSRRRKSNPLGNEPIRLGVSIGSELP